MHILITRQTSISGTTVRPGDVVEVDDSTARLLLRMGKATEAPAPEPEPVPEPPAPKRKPRSKVNTDGDFPADA